jgi:hypothetical protein
MLHFYEHYRMLITHAMQNSFSPRGVLLRIVLVAALAHPLPLYAQDSGGDGGGDTRTGSQGPAYGSSGAGGEFDDGSLNANVPAPDVTTGGVLNGDVDPRTSLFDSNVRNSRSFLFLGGWNQEDMSYRNDSLITTQRVYGSQPSEAMPHKTTKLFSPLNLNEWYLISMQNPSEPENGEEKLTEIRNQAGTYSPYIGPLYRGTYNLFKYNSRLNQPTQAGDRETTCKLMVESQSLGRDAYNPEWQRLEMDNCTNQYILQQSSRYTNMLHEEQSAIPGYSADKCQPLEMVPTLPNEEEYAADWYYVIAWEKLLSNSAYLARAGKAKLEPNYGSNLTDQNHKIRITDPIARPNGFGWTFLRDLASAPLSGQNMKFERILDPSHPFSPRWDFEDNERDKYSRYTLLYAYGDGRNTVRCSGGPLGASTIKVDIMKWRERRFHRHVTARLAFNIITYPLRCGKIRCWRLWGCTSRGYCCSTEWDRRDVVPTSWCNLGTGNSGLTMGQLCESLAKPVVPVNALKMRDAEDESNFPEGVPPGYRFDSYFKNHRPYMRCWDTGQECGLPQGTPYPAAMFMENGSTYAIMGAGREGQSCLIGGSEGRLDVPSPSPITDWMELKLYQVNSMRRGLFCLPRNELTNKYGDTEQVVLNMSGAAVQIRVPNPEDGEMNRYKTIPWPKAWRGYVMDIDPERRFPNFGGSGAGIEAPGLDNAKPGDILIFDEEVVMAGGKRGDSKGDDAVWRLPYVAYVTDANTNATREGGAAANESPDMVRVVAHNHGKFPDACGNTQDMYMGESFTMYKDALPGFVTERLSKVGEHTDKCVDPSLNDCIEPLWSTVKRYNIHADLRE